MLLLITFLNNKFGILILRMKNLIFLTTFPFLTGHSLFLTEHSLLCNIIPLFRERLIATASKYGKYLQKIFWRNLSYEGGNNYEVSYTSVRNSRSKKKLRGVFTRSTTIMQGAESSKRKTNFKMHRTKKFVQTRTRIASERTGQPPCVQQAIQVRQEAI